MSVFFFPLEKNGIRSFYMFICGFWQEVSASEVTTLWHFTNMLIIIIILLLFRVSRDGRNYPDIFA